MFWGKMGRFLPFLTHIFINKMYINILKSFIFLYNQSFFCVFFLYNVYSIDIYISYTYLPTYLPII